MTTYLFKMIMKTSKTSLRFLSAAMSIAALFAIGCSKNTSETHATKEDHHQDSEHHGEDAHHDDGEKSEEGPNGGRLITSVEPAVEFIVQEDRTVAIQLLDENRNPVTPTDQLITLIGGERTNPTTLAFARQGNRLVSDQPIPEGASVPVVLQIMASANAAVVREKFNANLSECPTCDYQEYACVCGHDDH
jgi:hypothetical protein